MTTLSQLLADAKAISTSSSKIRTFALDTVNYLTGLDGRTAKLEQEVAALQLGIRNVPLQVPPAGWYPPPPATTSASGTVSYTALDTPTGSTPEFAVFYTNLPHNTQNSYGVFSAYTYVDNNHGNPTYWRLKRSTDGGATFPTTLYDSQTSGNSDPAFVGAPAVETDADGNVYVIANYYSTGGVKFYKFTPPNYSTPTPVVVTGQSSNKWSCVLDQGRKWIWFCLWQNDSNPNLFAVDYAGTLVYSKNLFNVEAFTTQWGPEAHAFATYPNITVAKDGTLIVGWHSEASAFIGPNSYFDVRQILSFDSGQTFIGDTNATITLPVYADGSGPSGRNAYEIVNTSDANEFISPSDSNYYPAGTAKYNWNAHGGLAFNNNCVHWTYESAGGHPADHNPYARFNMSSRTVDKRISPTFQTNDGTPVKVGFNVGNFAQDTTQNGRLYYICQGTGGQGNTGKLLVLRSDDAGASWYQYALGASPPNTGANGFQYINAHRWVQTDGSIIGSFVLGDAPKTLYFYKVSPA